jgi:outer membrane protein assembly factor BamB
MTGVNRAANSVRVLDTAICAIDPQTGKSIWTQPLPGVPTAWGLAVDRDGRILVTLMDGRLLAFR